MTGATLVRRGAAGDFEAGPRALAPITGPRRSLTPFGSTMCARTSEKVVALTYDDGPDPEQTPAILDELAARDVRATFYVLTVQARAHPGLLHRIAGAGHEVGLHGVDHTRLTTLPAREALRRIRDGRRELQDLLGAPVTTYRPAYGAQTPAQYLGTRAMGLDVVIWTAWARDWFDDDVAAVADRAVGALHPGGVLLLHECTADTDPRRLPRPRYSRGDLTRRVLDGLARSGYTAVPMRELMAGRPAVRSLWFERRRPA